MQKYLVNSTYCIYLLDLNELYFDDSVVTIHEVIEEIKHERGIALDASLVPVKKTHLQGKKDSLSSTDLALLHTAKATNYILVTDDQKLIKAAHSNGVRPLDTPHFIHRLIMERKWVEEKALSVLNRLRTLYNRAYVIDKVITDIKNWR